MPLYTRLYNHPTQTINRVDGWKTKLLYSYWGDALNTTDNNEYLNAGKVDYTQYTSANSFPNQDVDLFEVIGYSQDVILNNRLSYIMKGGVEYTNIFSNITNGLIYFPADYWKTGKTVRIKGGLFLPGAGDGDVFSMRLRIKETDTDTNYNLAQTNNNAGGGNNNHLMSFKTESYEATGPYVNFEYTYASVVGSQTAGGGTDDENYQYLKAEGYFQYDNINTTNLRNDETRFVPVYDSNYYYEVAAGPQARPTRIMIDFNKSTTPTILLSYVTAEELQ